jgi:hypothetical protein
LHFPLSVFQVDPLIKRQKQVACLYTGSEGVGIGEEQARRLFIGWSTGGHNRICAAEPEQAEQKQQTD